MLYEHQQKLLDTAPDRYGLWWDCGLGKTKACLLLADSRLNKGHVLIVTTKSLKDNWKNEIDLWIKDKSKNIFLVVSKEEFRKNYKTLVRADCLILDEAHYAGNFKSQYHKALHVYIKVHNPKYIYMATATPIMSQVWSVWSLSKLLNKEVLSYWRFKQKYFYDIKMGNRTIPIQKKGIEADITADLKKIGSVVSKEEALDLPEQVHEIEYFTLNKAQEKAIKDLDNDPTSINHMTYFTKCLQIASGTLKQASGEVLEVPCDKLDRVLELVEQHPNICIVAKHTAELQMLHRHIPNSMIFDGGTPQKDRQEIINKINDEGGVLLLQSACGVGFNLTNTNLIVFYSHDWNYISYSQVLGRNGGLRQKGKNTYLHLIVKDTIDEDVWKCLERKNNFDITLYNREML